MKTIFEAVNSTGTVFVDFAWPMLVQSSLLIVILLGLDAILRKRARAVLRYWLWMIVLVKLMLPTTLAAPTSPVYWLSDTLRSFVTGLYSPTETSATRSVATGIPPALPAGASRIVSASSGENADSQPGFSASVRADGAIAPTRAIAPVAWQGCVFLAWLAAIVVMTALLIQRTSFVRSLVAQSETASDALAGILHLACQQMHVSTRVMLRLSPVITSPCVCGLIRPTILMPQSLFDRVSEPRFKAILLHELAHIKRGDLWVSCFQTFVQIVYIYSPLLWVANATIRKVREQAADETVLVALGEEADDYPKTLLDVSALAFGSPALSLRFLGVAESKKVLHRRIQHMLTRPVPQSANIGTVGIIAILVVAAILLPMARAEKSNKDVPVAASPTSVQAPQKAPVAEEGNVFVDPNTGIKFRKAGALSGPSDVIESATGLRISPNGKFLLSRVTVVPLDGSQPFTLADFPRGVFEGAWSPNGKKVAVEGGGTWVIPVNSETGRPTGPAEKVHESGFGLAVWSPDSEGLRFLPAPGAVPGFGHASLRHSGLTEVADGSKPAQRSPDGKQVAFVESPSERTVLSVKPVAGGPARKVANGGTPILWSADSAWLIYSIWHEGSSDAVEEPRFFRLADGREGKLKLPANWALVGPSPDGKKLLCYCSSYDLRERLEVISVAGGPPCQLGEQMPKLMPIDQFWSPDSGSVVVPNDVHGDDGGLVALPLSGAAPAPLRMDVRVPGKISYWQLSPRLDHVLFCVSADGKTYDIWAAPVSWKEMRTTGPATLVFKNWGMMPWGGSCTPGFWSPDGKKIAIMQKESEIWIASPEGGEPRQLIGGPGLKGWPLWSPDGQMIAFYLSLPTGHSLQVIPATGGEAKTVTQFDRPGGGVGLMNGRFGFAAWSPDGRALIVAKQRQISSISVSDGQSQPLVNAADIGTERMDHLRWSPDGKTLAFRARKVGESGNQLFLFRSSDGHVTKVADGLPSGYFWSPDSKWISHYAGSRFVKTRPEGVLWEMDVEEAVAKLAK